MTWMPPLRSYEDALKLVVDRSNEMNKLERARKELRRSDLNATVAQIPADLMGLIRSRFDWDNPGADIPRLIAEYLPNIKI